MTKNSSNIIKSFLNDFPEIFHSPQKVNDYLQDYSKNIEEIIVKDFVNFGLKDDFAIYANGGFGRQELYPSSE
jgi:UTP:GlnB (protein PII) uridylyltransferase